VLAALLQQAFGPTGRTRHAAGIRARPTSSSLLLLCEVKPQLKSPLGALPALHRHLICQRSVRLLDVGQARLGLQVLRGQSDYRRFVDALETAILSSLAWPE